MNDESQNIIDQTIIDEANLIKEKLCNEPWDKIKDDAKILKKAVSSNYLIDPVDMLLSERNTVIQRVFTNSNIIPQNKMSIILEQFINFDLSQDINVLQKNVQIICPNLLVNQKSDLKKLQADFKNLPNGLKNAKTIALYEVAKNITFDISSIKKLPQEQIDLFAISLNTLKNDLLLRYAKNLQPTSDQVAKIADAMEKFGRTNFQIQSMKEQNNNMTTVELLDRSLLAISVIQEAYSQNLVNSLDDLNTIVNLLEKVQEKES